MHGTRLLSWSELRETYGRELVNLRNEGRYGFLNTLFSVSEAVMYMQVILDPQLVSALLHRPCCRRIQTRGLTVCRDTHMMLYVPSLAPHTLQYLPDDDHCHCVMGLQL